MIVGIKIFMKPAGYCWRNKKAEQTAKLSDEQNLLCEGLLSSIQCPAPFQILLLFLWHL